MGAYVLGRYYERLATMQVEVGDLKMRMAKLENHKLRGEVRWGWFHRIASHIPFIKGFLR
jgi:hypothetical protein